MRIFIVYFFFISSAALASPFGFSKGSFALKSELSYLTSSKNFNDAGILTLVSSQNSVSEIRLDLFGAYDISQSWGLYSKVSLKQFTAQALNYNVSAFGMSDITMGSDFYISHSKTSKLIADFSALIPLTSIPGADRSVFYNDGAFNFAGKIYYNLNIHNFKNYAYAGVIWRGLGLSTQIPLGIHTRYFFTPRFFTSLSLEGELSLSNDVYTSNPSQRLIVNQAYNASSMLYNSVNPQLAGTKLELGGLVLSNFTLSGGAKYVFWGQRVAEELRFFVTLGYQSSLASDKKFQPDDDSKFQVDLED